MSRRSKAEQAGVAHIAAAAAEARERIAEIKAAAVKDGGVIQTIQNASEAIGNFERWSAEAAAQLRRELVDAIAPAKAPAGSAS